MSNTVRNILITIGGWIAGSLVNMALVNTGNMLIPPPAGFDLNTMEGLEQAMKLMEPKHFVVPFLAHALGTLTASWLIAKYAASAHIWCVAVAVLLFFLGGFYMTTILSAPAWFEITDLLAAYFPMGVLGYLLGRKKK
ncbi:MAG: hypothetical protein MUF12_05455 [Sediminibacterium sp.]|jgi:VIT1/CCC1 family predicted Fe2+/Mn2+ transporter|nr:hypothetical protein [Sediminibacterium sp.]